MLGSVDDAEEVVQDVYLDAWRAYRPVSKAARSLRTWLYRIATRAFVKALERRKRRPLPSDLHAPATDPTARVRPGDPELARLEPAPDSLLDATTSDPATVVAARETMRLAFVAALQLLPPRQRAVLVLREVSGWSAAEVGALLDLSVAAVNSALQRARVASARGPAPRWCSRLKSGSVTYSTGTWPRFKTPTSTNWSRYSPRTRSLEMPPFITWFEGSAAIGTFLGPRMRAFGNTPVIRTSANGQPAVALYPPTADGQHRLHALHVLTSCRTVSVASWPFRTSMRCGASTYPKSCRLNNRQVAPFGETPMCKGRPTNSLYYINVVQ